MARICSVCDVLVNGVARMGTAVNFTERYRTRRTVRSCSGGGKNNVRGVAMSKGKMDRGVAGAAGSVAVCCRPIRY